MIHPYNQPANIEDIKLLSASLKYNLDNMLQLSFVKPLINDLTKESISLYKNDILYSTDKLDLTKYEASNSNIYLL